jgi:hypothetical protein
MGKYKILFIVIIVLLTACYRPWIEFDGPDMKLKQNISDGIILVSDFEIEGQNLPDISAEELTQRLYDMLYLNTDLHVVNKKSLSDTTHVKYILKGSMIFSVSGMSFDVESTKMLTITLRITNSADNEVAGIITVSGRYKKGTKRRIDYLLERCVSEMRDI